MIYQSWLGSTSSSAISRNISFEKQKWRGVFGRENWKYLPDDFPLAFSVSQNCIGDCGVETLATSLKDLPKLHCLRYMKKGRKGQPALVAVPWGRIFTSLSLFGFFQPLQ